MIQPTIFLIEDNPDDVELTIKALQENHINVHIEIARDGAEAVDYLSKDVESFTCNWPPHVILLDMNLPKLSGLEVLCAFRNDPLMSVIPIIILTTSDDEIERLDCYSQGATSFIRKPVVFERFSDIMKQLGVYWLDINLPPPVQINLET
ncbi:response regulator [Magnetococcales bacterium HHB-1]